MDSELHAFITGCLTVDNMETRRLRDPFRVPVRLYYLLRLEVGNVKIGNIKFGNAEIGRMEWSFSATRTKSCR